MLIEGRGIPILLSRLTPKSANSPQNEAAKLRFFCQLPNPGHRLGLAPPTAQPHEGPSPCDGRNLRSGRGQSAQR
jgi:hypothetical protein